MRTSQLLKANRGYEKIKKNNKLELIDELKNQLTNTKLFKKNSTFSCLNTNSIGIDLEIIARQFILNRYVGISFNREILKVFSNSNYKFCLPIPLIWLKVLSNNGVRVNYIFSLSIWYIEMLKLFAYSSYEILRQCKRSLISIFNNELKKSTYVYFDSLTESNLPSINSTNNYGIISWYLKWKNENTVDYFAHSVPNKSKILLNESIVVQYVKSPFPAPAKFIILIQFVIFSIIKSFQSLIFLFIGKWWNILLLREFLLGEVVNLNKKNGLATHYLFHNSNWIYRPVWTYVAEKMGSQISFYFYSTNIERFKKGQKNAIAVNNSWELITWSKILVWDEYQKSFLNNNVIHENEIEIVGPISFQASKQSTIQLPIKSIAIFDVQPVRTSYYISLGLDQEYYIPQIVNTFLTDVIECIKITGLNAVFKRKREIGKLAHSQYTNNLNHLVKNNSFINIDPSIPAEEIIEKCVATISLPFTSTAIVAKHMGKPSIFYDPSGLVVMDDPAAHGIRIINNKNDLKDWLNTI
jgi:polysaccharide biosynthesis PFTS motif protein